MNNKTQSALTTKQLIIGLILAMIIGTGLTVFVILPAETGQDPTGFGAESGLDQLSSNVEVAVEVPVNPVVLPADALYVALDPETTEIKFDEFERSLPAMEGTNLRSHDSVFKSETIDIEIGLDDPVEYKAIMNQGEVLLYSWESSGELYYDFHAHQDESNPDFWTRYSEGEGKSDQGSIVAPYAGRHGWYWLNLEDDPITIKLTVAGYYDELIKVKLNSR